MLGAPEQSQRGDGWGARGGMKDASSTDVVVHNGRALTCFWQCGDVYALDPRTLEHQGEAVGGGLPVADGHLRPPQARRAHRRAARLRLRQGCALPALRVVSADGGLVPDRRRAPRARGCRTTWPSRSSTQSSTTSRCSGTRRCSRRGCISRGSPRYSEPLRNRAAARGTVRSVGSRRSPPTPALDQRLRGRRRGGARRLLPGRPVAGSAGAPVAHGIRRRSSASGSSDARPHRWRFDLVTGEAARRRSSTASGVRHDRRRRGGRPDRSRTTSRHVGWFLFDGVVKDDLTPGTNSATLREGVFGSERRSRRGRFDRGGRRYLHFTTDVGRDRSECSSSTREILPPAPSRGRLPERISAAPTRAGCPAWPSRPPDPPIELGCETRQKRRTSHPSWLP